MTLPCQWSHCLASVPTNLGFLLPEGAAHPCCLIEKGELSGNASWRRTSKGELHIWEEEGRGLCFPLYFTSSNPCSETERSSLQGCKICFMNFWKEGKGNCRLLQSPYCWQSCKKVAGKLHGKASSKYMPRSKNENNDSSDLFSFHSIRNFSQKDIITYLM